MAATLGATVPLFLGLQEPRHLDAKAWSGLGVGFLGVLVLLWPSARGPQLTGTALLLLSAALWSFGTLYGRRHAAQGGHFSQVGIEMLAAGALSLLAAPWTGGITQGPVAVRSLWALGYLILLGSILAYSAYIHLTRVWPPARPAPTRTGTLSSGSCWAALSEGSPSRAAWCRALA